MDETVNTEVMLYILHPYSMLFAFLLAVVWVWQVLLKPSTVARVPPEPRPPQLLEPQSVLDESDCLPYAQPAGLKSALRGQDVRPTSSLPQSPLGAQDCHQERHLPEGG